MGGKQAGRALCPHLTSRPPARPPARPLLPPRSEEEAARAYDRALWRLKPKEAHSYVNFKDEVGAGAAAAGWESVLCWDCRRRRVNFKDEVGAGAAGR